MLVLETRSKSRGSGFAMWTAGLSRNIPEGQPDAAGGGRVVEQQAAAGESQQLRDQLAAGMKKAPLVELNGRPLDRKLSSASVDGRDAWVVPLFHEAKLTDAAARLIERYRLATGELGRSAKQGR